ncbi:MAG: S-adenosylmethionine:tRNA ribosyltransferase-isomerase [Lewinellaceae bacterium]|nr:S-adenosylmethionine:tRNA ribosyltransferase-isomerase [Lewinellaceae bacterium]
MNREAIASLKEALEAGRPIIPVGTTSARLLESLYWHGAEVGSDRREPRTDEGGRGRKLEATVGSPAPTKEVGGGNPKLARKSPVLQRRRGEDGTEGLTIEPSNPETIEPSNHITIEPSTPPRLSVSQWQPYEQPSNLPAADALQAILGRLDAHDLDTLQGHTRLIIAPGYRFRIVSGMITNFHQPRSTLLLLIAALVGDRWRDAYQYALENDFRFLSYGDSCLLLPEG